jgi:DNA-binding response OmpR family regulator
MRILIAEDDATSRLLLTGVLQRWGYEVSAVCDGAAALAGLQQPGAPQLVILDWMMPGLEGPEICRRLRATPTDTPPYLILLTAQDNKKNVVEGLGAGANDYISKPFDMAELQARLAVGRRVLDLQQTLGQRVRDLQAALTHIKTLQGILPICMHCHKIRNDQQSWERLERYISEHAEVQFSHSICPECLLKHYPDVADAVNDDLRQIPISAGGTKAE